MQIHKHRATKWLKQVLSNQRYSNELMGDLAKKHLDGEDAFEVVAKRQQLFVVKKLHICLSMSAHDQTSAICSCLNQAI